MVLGRQRQLEGQGQAGSPLPIAHGQHRCHHASILQVPQQSRPGLSRLPGRHPPAHQHFLAIRKHPGHHQARQAVFFPPHPEIHPICPDMNVVFRDQRSLALGAVFFLPGLNQPRDGSGRQAGRLGVWQHRQRFGEVARRQASQIQDRKTSSSRGEQRLYGGRIWLVQRCPGRRSCTRGVWILIGLAPVVSVRGEALPFRTASAAPVHPACPASAPRSRPLRL